MLATAPADGVFDLQIGSQCAMHLTNHCFVIGAQKAGTTSLYRYLATHPQLFGSLKKETKFFCKAAPSPKRPQGYESYFVGRTNERWAFEASPHYTQFPKYTGVPERIHAAFPDARLIYIIRHPIERIYSHYIFRLASPSGRENSVFEEAIRTNAVYLDTSSYHRQLSQYLPLFSKSQIHVLLAEELAQDPRSTLKKLFEFLEIDSSFEPPNLRTMYNEGKERTTMMAPGVRSLKKSPVYRHLPWPLRSWMKRRLRVAAPGKEAIITAESYNRLHRLLSDDVARLKDYLGRDLPWDFPRSRYS